MDIKVPFTIHGKSISDEKTGYILLSMDEYEIIKRKPDPLQKALDAIEEVWAQSDVYTDEHARIDTRNIIRTLYEEATK